MYHVSLKGNFLKIKTFGDSMSPLFIDGDIVYFEKISFNKIKVNDFVVYKKAKFFITHRVIYKLVKRQKKYLITKGDNNVISDGKIFPKEILGKVFKVKRRNKYFNSESFYLYQSTLYFNQILKIQKAFTQAKIEFVYLKGLPLHLYFEKAHPRRIYLDCDILINSKDLPAVKKVFKKNHYSFTDNSLSQTHKRIKDSDDELSFTKRIDHFKITFDIHQNAFVLISQIGSLDKFYPTKNIHLLNQIFLKEKQSIYLFNEYFPILSHDNLIIYLALHLFHHNFKGYHRYNFIDLIIRKKKLNFNSISKKIMEFQLQSFTYPVFVLLAKHYYTPLPNTFLKRIEPNPNILSYISNSILKQNVFDDEMRIQAGINRFNYLYNLSPSPVFKKISGLINLRVLYSVFWVLKRKFTFLFRNNDFFSLKFFNKN